MTPKIRPIRVEGNIAYVPLTQGYEAVIDAADVSLVDGWNWYAVKKRSLAGSLLTVYAVRGVWIGGRNHSVLLHRVLLDAPEDMQCDHISGDGLDNRRSNLRLASHAENCRNTRIRRDNTSGAKGVYWHRQRGKWRAEIMVNGRSKHIGLFNDIDDAAAAYAAASAEYHGEFGRVG